MKIGGIYKFFGNRGNMQYTSLSWLDGWTPMNVVQRFQITIIALFTGFYYRKHFQISLVFTRVYILPLINIRDFLKLLYLPNTDYI